MHRRAVLLDEGCSKGRPACLAMIGGRSRVPVLDRQAP